MRAARSRGGSGASAGPPRHERASGVGPAVRSSRRQRSGAVAAGETAGFEELLGSHGGIGGPQTSAFLLLPAELPLDDRPIVGAPAAHGVLRRWVDAVSEGDGHELEATRTDIDRFDLLDADERVPRDEEP